MGRTLTLFCDAKGEPQPTITWYVNESLVSPDDKFTDNFNLTFGENQRFIQVPNVTLMDRGIYRCKAINQAGKDELLYKVDILRKYFLKY